MSKPQHQGEAIIRRAFYRSLLLVAMIALLAWALFEFYPDKEEPAPAATTEVSTPVARTPMSNQAPLVHFTDITRTAGIDFKYINGAYGDFLMPEAIGGGGGFIDYDNDGDQDILLVNANWWPGHKPEGAAEPVSRLYNNDGSGHFTDVTSTAGLALTTYGMGLAVGDYDNDGWDDVYITALGTNHLFHNDKGTFTDVSESSGTAGFPEEWSTGALFLDIDNDSDLDLFVANYVEWNAEINREIDFRVTGIGKAYSTPTHYKGARSRLYRNDGNGHFTDISFDSGVYIKGKALSATAVDYDHDGLLDIFVSNDTVQNFLFHNLGNGRFEEIGELEGIAFSRNGEATGAMGIDTAWYRNDNELGVVIGNFANEMSSLYVTVDGRTPFADEALLEGLGADSRLSLTFGLFFFDYDLDGRLDLLQANGHIETEINKVQPSQHYAQPVQLFWNCGDDASSEGNKACNNRLVLVENTGDLATPLVGRGASYADIDNDGDLDVLVMQSGREARLFRNDQHTGHHWLRIKLTGSTSNRNAVGAVIELSAGGHTQTRVITPGRSFLSQIEYPVTFGLGNADTVDKLTITWPGGLQQSVEVDAVDRMLTVTQPKASQ